MNKKRSLKRITPFNEHFEKYFAKSEYFKDLAENLEDYQTPSFKDKHWLPVDEILIRLAQRTSPPMLRRKDEKSFESSIISLNGGVHKLVRDHLTYAFQRIAGADPKYRQYEIDDANSFIEHAVDLKKAVITFLNDAVDRPDAFTPFASGCSPEETGRRIKLSIEAQILLRETLRLITEIEGWAWESLDQLSPIQGGKPRLEWKHEFVSCLAHTWWLFTGRPAPAGPNTLFTEFVDACWLSAGDDIPEESWEATIRAVCSKGRDEKTGD